MNKKILFLVFPLLSQCALDAVPFSFDLKRARRRINAHTIKSAVSNFDELTILSEQNTNGDEQLYSDKHASFNKALKHLSNVFPDPSAFASLVKALDSGSQSDFNNIAIGSTAKLANPQASFTYSLAANDGWINPIAAAPQFTSAQAAGEMVEDYWSVLLRDVSFADFGTDPTATSAIADLNNLSDFKGPKIGGAVTSQTLLRGDFSGCLEGPYISQFLYKNIPSGPYTITQQITPPTGVDFIKTIADYTTVINGGSTGSSIAYGTARYIITPRDLTEYVHKDFPAQAGIDAALIMNSFGSAALDKANPYINNKTQGGFVTFGIDELLALVGEATHEGLKAAWYQKWQVHRRLRPEEFGFYLNDQIINGNDLNIHSDLLNSAALPLIFAANTDNYLLAQAYPEGCPTHPSYPAGHAVIIGAVTTILKAWFNEDFAIPSPVEPSADGSMLNAYGSTLTIGGELNKLACNISIGRNIAGVHYRSDGDCGMRLGELVAIDILNNTAFLFNEDFKGFSLTTFDGKKITVGAKRTV